MRGQPNRLAADTAGPFAGSAIDRDRPLAFRLDGRRIEGFAGDSVLSAVLAAGIDSLGQRHDGPMALSSRFAPAIIAAERAHDPQQALAMAQTPATDGADYLTLPARPRWQAQLRRWLPPRSTLGLALAEGAALPLPFMANIGTGAAPAEVIVVGGGVAGMAAAVAAAAAGLSVILLEAAPRLGGSARLFGTLEGEESADASLLRLGAAIAGSGSITVLTRALVFAARPGAVRAHLTDTDAAHPRGRVLTLQARHIVFATGSTERLPVFAGNRLPGTVGVREAWDMAQHYGVWCGQSALLATASNVAYRLAMLARDAGIAVPRILDSRTQPQSRFIEFSKAYGITLAAGTSIAEARPGPQRRGLAIQAQLRVGRFNRDEPLLMADRLVLCGGWQPDLALWHSAGGSSGWDDRGQRLAPGQGPEGLVLAGNAAGYRGHQACLASGAAAIEHLLGRAVPAIAELEVDPIYESPDGPTPIADIPARPGAPAFLDGGRSGVVRPLAPAPAAGWLGGRPPAYRGSLADGPLALHAADIAAGVQLGAIAAERAGPLARQRVAMIAMGSTAEPTLPTKAPLVPDFLAGRFGDKAEMWLIRPDEARSIEPGALIQPNGDVTDPLAAIGVVLRPAEGGTLVLLAASHARAGQSLTVREHGRAIAVRLVAPHDGGAD
mgnify:CR=1 FL=1